VIFEVSTAIRRVMTVLGDKEGEDGVLVGFDFAYTRR
jgi:hypothetical protein